MKKSKLVGFVIFTTIMLVVTTTCQTTKKTKPCTQCPSYTKEATPTSIDTTDSVGESTAIIIPPPMDSLVYAMIQVESRGNDSAYCGAEDAVGCLQIRPIMVEEVNRVCRILGIQKSYSLEDRWSRSKSIEMLKIFARFYHLEDFEEVARCWNGGPSGMTYASTEGYWNKVQNEMI
jgi:hypothetical protein